MTTYGTDQKTSRVAVAALIAGILSVLAAALLSIYVPALVCSLASAAVVLGVWARQDLKRSGAQGFGLSLAGFLAGAIVLAVILLPSLYMNAFVFINWPR